MEAVLDIFNKWDRNGNGRIDRDELRMVLLGMGLDDNNLPGIFCTADKNRDDGIDVREFLQWIYSDHTPAQVAEHVNEMVRRIAQALKDSKVTPYQFFDRVDLNKDQCLSFGEFTRVCRHFDAGFSDLDLMKAFTHFDSKGSGSIDAQSFRRRLEQALAAKDRHTRPSSAPAQRHADRPKAEQGDMNGPTRIHREIHRQVAEEFRTPEGEPKTPVVVEWHAVKSLGGRPLTMQGGRGGAQLQSVNFKPEAYNDHFVWDPGLLATSDWRGSLAAAKDSSIYPWASYIIAQALTLARIARDADNVWLCHGEALAQLLGTRDPQTQEQVIVQLADACQKIVSQEPTLVRVSAPAKVFGDVHGQLKDLLSLFDAFAFPTHRGGDVESISYVFNGDWVDRGPHQLEVIVLLFSLKVMYPSRIFLVRGNHEFRDQNEAMGKVGFDSAVLKHLGAHSKVYQKCHHVFDWLPLGALIQDVALVVHGGIGDGQWSLSDLEFRVQRPLRDCFEAGVPHFVPQVLWSDPTDSDDLMHRGVHYNFARNREGLIKSFGPDITKDFCRREHLQIIIRSHQLVKEGVKFMHGGRLVTVFSACNYHPSMQNDGALLLLATDADGKLRIRPKTLEHL